MIDPQEDNKVVGNMAFGPTGANNDVPTGTSGDTLEGMVMGAGTSFSGVPAGQQEPRSGS